MASCILSPKRFIDKNSVKHTYTHIYIYIRANNATDGEKEMEGERSNNHGL
jgi:hypothetical protein